MNLEKPGSAKLPRISVVTANYNQGRWLQGCLESLHSQHYPALEHIVMDGGSTDGSIEIIQKFADRLAHWSTGKDGGQYQAIENGFQRATGEILAWLNADDLYLPWTLATVGSIFASLPEVEWLTSIAPAQVAAEGAIFAAGSSRPVSKDAFLDGLYVPGGPGSLGVVVQEGTFWRRSLWERTKPHFTPVAPYAGDYELWCRFMESAEIYNVGLPLAAMTRHDQQRSNHVAEYRAECGVVLAATRKTLSLPERPSWRAGVAAGAHKNQAARRIASRLCGYSVRVVERLQDQSGYPGQWVTKQLRLW